MSVIVEHVQNIWIIRAIFVCLWDLLSFAVPAGTEKITGLCFAKGDQYPGWHYVLFLFVSGVKVLDLRFVERKIELIMKVKQLN